MARGRGVAALIIVLAAAAGGVAAVRKSARPRARVFTSSLAMEPRFVGALRQIDVYVDGLNVTKPPKDLFPASFWPNERCSGTLIGPQVLVTAAHCVDGDPHIKVPLVGKTYTSKCVTAYAWTKGNSTADVALCKMSDALPVPFVETVALDVTGVKAGDPVLLTGYGGSTIKGEPIGVYLTGTALVDRIEGNVLVTRGDAWLTPGDSGGAGYLHLGEHRRVLISVNSNVVGNGQESRLELLAGVRDFVTGWSEANGVGIQTIAHLSDYEASRKLALEESLRNER